MRKILYVAGASRSGSTILDIYLSRSFNMFSVGELTYFFEKGVLKGELCACGSPVTQCAFWSSVIRAFGWKDIIKNAEIYSRLTDRFDGIKGFLRSFRLTRRNELPFDVSEYLSLTNRLLSAVFQVLGTGVILLDSSKLPSRALWCQQLSDYDTYVLHFARDAAATAFSWTQKKLRPEASYLGKDVYMVRLSYRRALFRWMRYNLYATMLRYRFPTGRYRFMRYECFVAEPEALSKEILTFVGGEPQAGWNNRWGYHSIAGNPLRLNKSADLTIVPDHRARKALPLWKSGIANLMSLPLSKYMNRR